MATITLDYKLEYLQGADQGGPSDEGVMIHTKIDLPNYISLIGKEDYTKLATDQQTAFITGLFALPGITELSVTRYRVFVEKSPAFDWTEVIPPILSYLQTQLGATALNELPGSKLILSSYLDRRSV